MESNQNKMRKTLELVLRFLQWMYAQEDENAAISRVRVADEIDRVISALAAPARNCDKFDDYKSAKDYFLENEWWKYNHGLTPEYWFGEWLFAQAEKGDAK